jgi:dTDP-4-amino-4,6-dideoxygalactose transaminase
MIQPPAITGADRIDPRVRYFYRTWYRVPFLVPAWDHEEIEAALMPGGAARISVDADPRGALKEELWRRFGFEHVVLTSTGSFALEAALCALPAPGEVIVPALICGTVARAIVRAGCVPVPADVNDDLTLSAESAAANITDLTVAVVVAHLSGTPARDLVALETLCARRGVALIDDAAQAIGIRSASGRHLGAHGRFGILSFGVGKPTFSLGGGALVASSREDAARCEEIVRQVDVGGRSSRGDRARAIRFVLEYCWRQYTLPVFAAERAMRRMAGRRVHEPQRGGIDAVSAALQVLQLRKIDSILRRFRANGERIIARVAGRVGASFPQQSSASGYTKLLLSVDRGSASGLASALMRRGIEIEWSYRPIDGHTEFAAYRRSSNPRAERVWTRLLALPNHPLLSATDTAYVGDMVSAALEDE